MHDIEHLPGIFTLGYLGETNFRTIEIDMSAWLDEIPNGVASVIHIRPGESADQAYMAATTFEDGILKWPITALDLGNYDGYGTMQISLHGMDADNHQIGKSENVRTRVNDSATSMSGDIPDAQQAWMDRMTELIDEQRIQKDKIDNLVNGIDRFPVVTYVECGSWYNMLALWFLSNSGQAIPGVTTHDGESYGLSLTKPEGYEPRENDLLMVRITADLKTPYQLTKYYISFVDNESVYDPEIGRTYYTDATKSYPIDNMNLHYDSDITLFEKDRVYVFRYHTKQVDGRTQHVYDVLNYTPGLKEAAELAETALTEAQAIIDGNVVRYDRPQSLTYEQKSQFRDNIGAAELLGGKIPASQLPSYVDDVLEYSSQSAFPSTGESGKIYVALDANLTYRWTGSTYIEISQSLALGETAQTAFPGDRGLAVETEVENRAKVLYAECTEIVTNPAGFRRICVNVPNGYSPKSGDYLAVKFPATNEIANPPHRYALHYNFHGAVITEDVTVMNLAQDKFDAGTVVFEADSIYLFRHIDEDECQIVGHRVGQALGDTAGTAFPGERGKAVEDSLAEVNKNVYATVTDVQTVPSGFVIECETDEEYTLQAGDILYVKYTDDVQTVNATNQYMIRLSDQNGSVYFSATIGNIGATEYSVGITVFENGHIYAYYYNGTNLQVVGLDIAKNDYVTPEMFGAVGDGITDDSQAVQDACDSGYAVYFASNKTYYLASVVVIDHDCHLYGGENTVIKTMKPNGGTYNGAFNIQGTLKKTTTLTSDYMKVGQTDNRGNQFTFADITGISIGDLIVITATDQSFSKARRYYYLGAVLLVSDIYDDHIYTTEIMPFNIENTENVSVKIYTAPTAVIENFHFVSNYDGVGSYTYLLALSNCKNSIVRNCSFSQVPNGLQISKSVNTLVDSVELSKSKYDNSLTPDGYGIGILSSTNTIIRRVISICAQHCITTGGDIPCLNTYFFNCNLGSECRTPAIGMHENANNTVVEDCTLFGASFAGTTIINRCAFHANYRVSSTGTLTYNGSDNPDFSTCKITNCTFDNALQIQLSAPSPQTPIGSFECMWDSVIIEDCIGGRLLFINSTSETITANIVNKLIIRRWKDCYDLYINTNENGNAIKYLEVEDSTFRTTSNGGSAWITQGTNGFNAKGIEKLYVHGGVSSQNCLLAESPKYGNKYTLPEGIKIALSSINENAHYIVCGSNLASNNIDDYKCGSISATVGSQISFSVTSYFSQSLSVDSNGNLVFAQPSGYSGKGTIYLKCMTFAPKGSIVKMSCILKDTGSVTGHGYRAYIYQVSCKTGLVTQNRNSSEVIATSAGALLSYRYTVAEDSMIIVGLVTSTAAPGSETTFENYVVEIVPSMMSNGSTAQYKKYVGSSCDGDNTLLSVDGANYIMSSETVFDAVFCVDYSDTPVGTLPSGAGASF